MAELSIGLSSTLFGRKPPRETDFAELAENNIRFTEIGLCRYDLVPCDLRTVKRISEWAERYGVAVNSVHGPCGKPDNGHWLADPDEDRRANAVNTRRDLLKACRDLGAGLMVVEYECYDRWPYWPHECTYDRLYSDSPAIWKRSVDELIDDAVDCGVGLAIENIDGLPCKEISEPLRRWDESVVGTCFDSSHASYSGDGFFRELEYLLPRLVSTHLSDNDAMNGSEWVDRHWPPFTGAVDWPRLMERLVNSGYTGCLMLEILNEEKRVTEAVVASMTRLEELKEKCLGAFPSPEKS